MRVQLFLFFDGRRDEAVGLSRFAMLTDRFGVGWMVIVPAPAP